MADVKYTTPACMLCKKKSVLFLDRKKFQAWQAGQHLQHAFPDLSSDDRELINSGSHPKCWDTMFPDE